ncbi:MAG: hypothetical protein AAGF77_13910 [Bacteroidota bacterium]
MFTKVRGNAVFGIEATTMKVEVKVHCVVGNHLVGFSDNSIHYNLA